MGDNLKYYLRFFCAFFLLNTFFNLSIFSDDIKIQRVLDTEVYTSCITQDKDGLLWIGTRGKGLLCFNGYEVEKIQCENNEFSTKIIPSIFIDSEGLIWFFTLGQGLYSYNKNNGIYKNYKPEAGNPKSLSSDRFYWLPDIITEDQEGLIWIGTSDGLNCYNKKTDCFIQYKHDPFNPHSLSNNSIWVVFVDSGGLIWIGTENGLNSYNKQTGKFTCYKHDLNNSNSLSENFVTSIAEDKEKNLWIGTKNNGIDKFDPMTGRFINYKHNPDNSNSLSHNGIYQIKVDRFDNFWICTAGGTGIDLYNKKLNAFRNYRSNLKDADSLRTNNTMYFFEDKSGIMWSVDLFGGIDKCVHKNDAIKIYSHNSDAPYGISSNVVIGLYEDMNKNIWLGTHDGGLCFLSPQKNKFKCFKHHENDPSSLPYNAVYSILEESKNKIWLGVDGGNISLFDIIKGQIVKNFKNPYSEDTPRNLTKDNENPNELWFTSVFSGLFKLNTVSGKVVQYKHVPGNMNCLSNDTVLSLLQDEDTLWIGTYDGGLNAFNKTTGKFITYRHDPNNKNSISGDIVVTSYIDSKGNFWVTTDDGGLNKFDKKTGKFTHLGIEYGFPSKSTRHILEDKDGYLWITTDSGILKFDKQKLKVIRVLTKEDGLPNNVFNIRANAMKDSNGDLWFSTLKGLCRFSPREISNIRPNSYIPQVILTSFKSKEGTYNEKEFKKLTTVKLPWPDNSFEFTFAVLDYMEPEKNQYAYKLEGFDKDWKYIGNNHFGQYSNLTPGKYALHLIGSNNNGVWNKKGTSINITIIPPFWMTWWFRGLCAMVLLGIVSGTFQIRTKALRKKTKLLEDHNAELTKEIEERKRAEAERTRAEEERKEAEIQLCKTKLEAKLDHDIAELTSGVAHDVSKPFNYLKTTLQVLPRLTPEQTQKYAEELDIIIRKVEAMLDDLKEMSREKPYDRTPENILSVLDLSIKDISRFYPDKKVNFFYQLDTVRLVNLDENRMCRALENIISNAFDFLPDNGGFMWFSVRKTTPAQPQDAKIIEYIQDDNIHPKWLGHPSS